MPHFIHRYHDAKDTIAAIATPPGEGGIAVIRISGVDALAIANGIFSGDVLSFKSHTAHFGHIINAEREHVDDVLLLVLRAPRSYTGEDTVEIHCHGGQLITRKVLDTVLHAGARAAEPGEFTFRAFCHGKMDLAQAEAVQQFIGAKSDLALQAAEAQLHGRLSQTIAALQKELTQCTALLEAYVDFPEEDLPPASKEALLTRLQQLTERMAALAGTFYEGNLVRTGPVLALVGPPNAGKSSLMNALLRKNRAIVTDVPGTTRDLIEEELVLGPFHFRLCDTAGLRTTEEAIEREGIRRAKQAMGKADLVLFVLDAHAALSPDAHALAREIPKERALLLWNKVDLPHAALPSLGFPHALRISVTSGEGLASLKSTIVASLQQRVLSSREEIVLTKERHHQALLEACEAVKRAIDGVTHGTSPEFVALDMRTALSALGSILGTDITEDILSSIFSQFCIGK